MSINLEGRTDPPGDATHEELAWGLKEQIRQRDGVLKQRRGFFSDAYKRSKTQLLFQRGTDGQLVGFVSTRRDGYILFLAVHPDARGRGYGKRLVAEVADGHESVTCHARTTNQAALEFYDSLGFDVERRIDSYYEDGGDAYYLKLGDDGGLASKLSSLLR